MPSCVSLLSSAILTVSLPWASAQVLPCGGSFTNVQGELYPSATLSVGENAFLALSYTAPETIDGGFTVTSVNIDGMPYPDIKGTLCSTTAPHFFFPSNMEEYEAIQGVPCPIEAGTHSSNDSFAVPNIEGTVRSKIQWFTDGGALLLCLKVIVDIAPAPIVW
jgi:hypothetical protein